MDTYASIFPHIESADAVVVDPVRGRKPLDGTMLLVDGEQFFVPSWSEEWPKLRDELCRKRLVVFDIRRIVDWPLAPDNPVRDVKLLWGGERELRDLVRREFAGKDRIMDRFLELDDRVRAHFRAAKTARMGPPVGQVIPAGLQREWDEARIRAIDDLYRLAVVKPNSLVDETEERWRFILALRQIELAGIKVDTEAIEKLLPEAPTADASCLRSMQSLQKDGFITALLNPIGTKTGRLRHEGGFNCLGIPKGCARRAIVSRHEGGLIFTFDFNAIDYRCIVRSIGGDFARTYEGADDFHERTASFLFKEVSASRRKLIKAIIYAYTYGGSPETLMEATGLSRELVKLALDRLDQHIRPIAEFREALYMRAQEDGFVDPPGGKRVYVLADDHAGKVLGLYAQTYSSYAFERATEAVHYYLKGTKSCVIFTVYDELVVDMHPDDLSEAEKIRDIMQNAAGGGWKVKIKRGRSYGEQDQR